MDKQSASKKMCRFIVACCLLINVATCAPRQPLNDGKSDEFLRNQLAAEFFRSFSARQFDKSASLLFYPSRYSPEERAEEKAGVAKSFAIVYATLGSVKDFRMLEPSQRVYAEVEIAGGTVDDIATGDPLIKRKFATPTTLHPDMVMSMTFIRDPKWKIRGVSFSLPYSSESAIVMTTLAQRLLRESLGVEPPPGFSLPLAKP